MTIVLHTKYGPLLQKEKGINFVTLVLDQIFYTIVRNYILYVKYDIKKLD